MNNNIKCKHKYKHKNEIKIRMKKTLLANQEYGKPSKIQESPAKIRTLAKSAKGYSALLFLKSVKRTLSRNNEINSGLNSEIAHKNLHNTLFINLPMHLIACKNHKSPSFLYKKYTILFKCTLFIIH